MFLLKILKIILETEKNAEDAILFDEIVHYLVEKLSDTSNTQITVLILSILSSYIKLNNEFCCELIKSVGFGYFIEISKIYGLELPVFELVNVIIQYSTEKEPLVEAFGTLLNSIKENLQDFCNQELLICFIHIIKNMIEISPDVSIGCLFELGIVDILADFVELQTSKIVSEIIDFFALLSVHGVELNPTLIEQIIDKFGDNSKTEKDISVVNFLISLCKAEKHQIIIDKGIIPNFVGNIETFPFCVKERIVSLVYVVCCCTPIYIQNIGSSEDFIETIIAVINESYSSYKEASALFIHLTQTIKNEETLESIISAGMSDIDVNMLLQKDSEVGKEIMEIL